MQTQVQLCSSQYPSIILIVDPSDPIRAPKMDGDKGIQPKSSNSINISEGLGRWHHPNGAFKSFRIFTVKQDVGCPSQQPVSNPQALCRLMWRPVISGFPRKQPVTLILPFVLYFFSLYLLYFAVCPDFSQALFCFIIFQPSS